MPKFMVLRKIVPRINTTQHDLLSASHVSFLIFCSSEVDFCANILFNVDYFSVVLKMFTWLILPFWTGFKTVELWFRITNIISYSINRSNQVSHLHFSSCLNIGFVRFMFSSDNEFSIFNLIATFLRSWDGWSFLRFVLKI